MGGNRGALGLIFWHHHALGNLGQPVSAQVKPDRLPQTEATENTQAVACLFCDF